MNKPPKHYPRTLDRCFAADVFDKRFRGFDRNHTSLGLLVELWYWHRVHKDDCGPAIAPIIGSIEEHLRRECPDAIEELERIG